MSWLDTLEDIRKKDFTKVAPSARDKAARDVVNLASYASAVVSVSPIPFSDAVLMLPIQSAMVMTVGHIYGRRVTKADARQILIELGTTAGVGLVARQGIKALMPVFGALLTVPAAFAASWAMGRVAVEYFRSPGQGQAKLRRLYQSAKDEGSSLFSPQKFAWFRRRSAAAAGVGVDGSKKKAPAKAKGRARAKPPRSGTVKAKAKPRAKPAATSATAGERSGRRRRTPAP